MGLFDFGKNKKVEASIPQTEQTQKGYQVFGTPLVKIGNGDLTKPYIDSNYKGNDIFVSFGADNLYPQLIDQMFYQSSLHAAIVKFQVNSAIGGGYSLTPLVESPMTKVNNYAFEKGQKLSKLIKGLAFDLKIHSRAHFFIYQREGKIYKIERILPSKIRYNKSRTKFWHSENWLSSSGIFTYNEYTPYIKDEISILSFINLEDSPGQDVYPFPDAMQAFNSMFLEGQIPNLQKENIQRSIFGNVVIRVPKKFETEEEQNELRGTIKTKEGNIVSALVLTGDGFENVPEVESFPVNQNDKLFETMSSGIDDKIAQSHQINPIIMGIERPGSLGSGSDIIAAYPIWVNAVLTPFKSLIEECINEIVFLFGLESNFSLNEYSVVEFGEGNNETKMSSNNSEDSQEAPVETLKGLSAAENNDIYRIIRDFKKEKLNEEMAVTRLMSYGLSREQSLKILK